MATPSHPAYSLLARAHSADTAAELFRERVQLRPLIVRPTSPDPQSQDARAARQKYRIQKAEQKRRRQRPKPLSAKEKRILDLYAIPKKQQRYALYEPLHRLWLGYMQEILGIARAPQATRDATRPPAVGDASRSQATRITPAMAGPKLASADFHGAELEVTRCRSAGRVGTKGIVLKDTKFTFVLVTRANQLRTVPKADTTFRFQIPLTPLDDAQISDTNDPTQKEQDSRATSLDILTLELHGSNFQARAPERATKRFKHPPLKGLI